MTFVHLTPLCPFCTLTMIVSGRGIELAFFSPRVLASTYEARDRKRTVFCHNKETCVVPQTAHHRNVDSREQTERRGGMGACPQVSQPAVLYKRRVAFPPFCTSLPHCSRTSLRHTRETLVIRPQPSSVRQFCGFDMHGSAFSSRALRSPTTRFECLSTPPPRRSP